jgi:hypothetical protein
MLARSHTDASLPERRPRKLSILNRVRASFRWVHALDLASKRQYRNALDVLVSIERLFSDDGARHIEFETEVALLKASMLVHLKQYNEALASISKINKTLTDRAVRNSEYFLGYLSELFRFVISREQLVTPLGVRDLVNVRLEDIDLHMVPKRLKMNFPLPSHPEWHRFAP